LSAQLDRQPWILQACSCWHDTGAPKCCAPYKDTKGDTVDSFICNQLQAVQLRLSFQPHACRPHLVPSTLHSLLPWINIQMPIQAKEIIQY